MKQKPYKAKSLRGAEREVRTLRKCLADERQLGETLWHHSLLLWAIVAGVARWEAFPDKVSGEVCVGGLRYLTRLDKYGCPSTTGAIHDALLVAKGAGIEEAR